MLSPSLPACFARQSRYELIDSLGEGGMSHVYEAQQQALGRRVALKVLRPEFLDHLQVLAQFRQEGEILAHVPHPHVVEVYDRGTTDGIPFVVLEYLSGPRFSDLMACQTRPDFTFMAESFCNLACALAAVHRAGFVHGDVKPSNVMLGDHQPSQVKLIDFGVSSRHGQLIPYLSGTPSYMAPERLDGEAPCPANDVFGLGAMAFEILTGHPPFEGQNFFEVRRSQMLEPVPDLRLSNPSVDPTTALLIRRMLAPRPADRPSMLQVASWFRRLGGGAVPAVPTAGLGGTGPVEHRA